MIIDKTGRRRHIGNHNVITPDGVQHPYLTTSQICAAFGYTEIADPSRADDRYYFNTEQDTPPYIVSTIKSLDQVKAAKLSELAAYRYAHMVGGTTLGGMPIATDDYTQTKLTQAWAACQVNPAYTTNWKSNAGGVAVFTQLTAAQIIPMAQHVAAFVGKCYDNEAAHFAAINALTDPLAVIAYDFTTGWPL